MNKYLYILPGWLLLSVCILTGCIRESFDDCIDTSEYQVVFNFRYDYNMQYTDRFAEEVNHISLFIYDAHTEELKQRIDVFRTDMEANHTISTTLPAGQYVAVAWGNCDRETDYFAITQTEKLTTLKMGLTCIDENNEATINKIGSVFHAMNRFEATNQTVTIPMSMTKNTNRVRVIVRGMDRMSKEEAEEVMKIRITSNNWLHNHDNTLATDQFIEYRSEYTSNEEIIADFYILRMQVDDTNEVYINLQYRELGSGKTPTVVLEKSLIPLLVDLPTPVTGEESNDSNNYAHANELLDRQDEYEIVFDVAADANGNIYIDSWDHITKPGEF